VEKFADRLAKKMNAEQRALDVGAFNRTASAHFIGAIPIADTAEHGVVDPYQRAFGQPGLRWPLTHSS
jgi:cholesterol oxidase